MALSLSVYCVLKSAHNPELYVQRETGEFCLGYFVVK